MCMEKNPTLVELAANKISFYGVNDNIIYECTDGETFTDSNAALDHQIELMMED